MTIFMMGILGLIFIIAIIYYFPSPADSFETLYSKALGEQRSLLKTFRLHHDLRGININDTDRSHLATGAGSESIVFLHAMGGGYNIWWQKINHFKAHYRIISMTYPPVTTLAELSAGIIAILDKEKIGRAIIVSSSLGHNFVQYWQKLSRQN